MKGGNLAQVLAGTLNPSTIHSSNATLHQMDASQGFVIDLLLLSDDSNQDINVRQSALVYLKNLLQRHCREEPFLPQNDLETLKASLLQALIRNVTSNKLIPTFRELVFVMAQKFYPIEWPNIVDECVALLQTSNNLEGLLGAVQTLKAIYSVFGGSIMKHIQLSNLCNKSILPLLSLASKLFQNFNQETSYVLVGIFKVFSTAILNHMPEIIRVNIHNLMIFVKKLLDLPADLSSEQSNSVFLLKKICLRILFRIYQKHANPRMTQQKDFAHRFHSTYTKSFVETLMMQVMFKEENDRLSRHRCLELAKLSLSTLSYINRQNRQAAELLAQYRASTLRLCMEKFRSSLNRNYVSFTEFKMYMQENRVHFKEFVLSLLSCDAFNQQQGQAATEILSLLLDYLEKGSDEHKQLALYLFTEMSTEIKYLADKVDDKMVVMIQSYVKPMLAEGNHLMIRARACQLITHYSYLDLPEQNITELAGMIYSCMLVGKSEQETFLKIYAINAFNSLMKYDQIETFVKPFIPELLKIYTDLLEADASVMKNFEDLIDLLQEQIAPYANDLAKMLIGMFVGYTQHQPQQGYRPEKQEDDDDDSEGEQEDTNNERCARACLSSIRQILQASKTKIHEDLSSQLFDIVLWIFSDRNQDYIEEGFNVLNLLLYKKDGQLPSQYFLFFRVIAYGILGLPQSYINELRQKGDRQSHQYADILENVSVEPDKDLIQNAIGCLRNFIAKCNSSVLRNERDEFGNSYLYYIFKIVKQVHESQEQSQSNRLIVLTLYISLIEYEAVDDQELGQIIGQVENWMQMEEQIVQGAQQNNGFSTFGIQQNSSKFVYSPVYLQILLLSVNFYKAATQRVNIVLAIQKIVLIRDTFQCDSELSRIIVSISHILDNQLVGDQQTVRAMLEVLPQFVRRLCNIRQNGDSPENDFDLDDEAEEEKAFGDDENTHMLGMQGIAPSNKDMMLGGGEDEEEDDDWEMEFNKFYVSPLDKVEELKYLQDVLSKTSHLYGPYMSQENKQQLSLYFANAPLKLSQPA